MEVTANNDVLSLTKGYKQTEVGLIPEDWVTKKISDISDVDSESLSSSTPHKYKFKYISLESINKGVIKNFIEYEFINAPSRARRILRKGDVVFGTVRPNLQSHFIVENEVVDFICSTGFAVIRPKGNFSSRFIFEQIMSSAMLMQLNALLVGSNYPAVNSNEVKSLKIPIPPLAEQKAIANVLSDTDALIQALEKKIAKKKLIKKGVMQKLLSPKEGWETKRLNEVCWFQEGPGLRNWQFTSSGIKVINVTNLVNGYLDLDKTDRHISLNEFNKMYKHFEIDERDIVMASSGNSYSKVSIVRKQDLPLLMNTSVIRFKPTNSLTFDWLLIFLKSKLFKNQIDLLITGGAQPNFGPFHLNKIEISFPLDEKEQNAISKIIMDINMELETLEQKLSKYQHAKQGMMQQLLTGKIRLI